MAQFNNKFDSLKQEWATPQSLISALDGEFHFSIDLAADKTNTVCKFYYSKKEDALKQPWTGVGWLNPPYGDKSYRISDWVRKSFDESQKPGCTIVMLVPARTNTAWWHRYCMHAKEVRFILGRPKFGNAIHGLPQPLAIVIFERHDGDTKFSTFVLKD